MSIIKFIFGILAGIFIIIGFLSWRMEFALPYYSCWYYILVGVFLVISLFIGRIIGQYLILGSFIPIGYSLILVLFFKETQWKDVSYTMYVGASILGIGILLYIIGPKIKDVYCAKCDQYLGKDDNPQIPCSRCGSNRYRIAQ